MTQIKNFFSKKVSHLWFWVIIMVAVYFLFAQKYKLFYLQGDSMAPSYIDGQWSIVQKKHTLKNWHPQRFDVVVIKYEGVEPKELITKRVIGLPSEMLKIKNGNIYINDIKLKDPFAYSKCDFHKEIRIPKGYVWVIGDNRKDSLSGLFKIDKIFGMIVW